MRLITKLKNKLRGESDLSALQKEGLCVGKNFSYGRYCFFDPSHCFLITIGNNVTFSTRVHLLCHDASVKRHIGYAKIGRIDIGDNVFVGANVTILPGVKIGDNSIIGAGSVVTKNVNSNMVCAGVPAKELCTLNEYISKVSSIDNNLTFEEEYTVRGGVTYDMKLDMKNKLDGKIGLVR